MGSSGDMRRGAPRWLTSLQNAPLPKAINSRRSVRLRGSLTTPGIRAMRRCGLQAAAVAQSVAAAARRIKPSAKEPIRRPPIPEPGPESPPIRGTLAGIMAHVGVLGAGAWGTALGKLLADKGNEVWLWAHEPSVAEGIDRDGDRRSV